MWIRPLLPNPPDLLPKIICKIKTCIFCDDSAALFNSLETGGFSAHPDRFTVRRKERMKKIWKKTGILLLALLVFLMPLSLKSQAAAAKPQKLKLSAAKESLLPGKRITLKVKAVTPATASKSVLWRSSDPKVASVDKKGRVTAKKPGTAKITATSRSNRKAKAVCRVTVFKKGTAARSIALNKTKLTLMKGKSQTLKIKRIRPLGASSRVKWTSSNKKVAVVNSKGKVTAKGKGTAVIKAVSAKNKKAVARCKVTVYQKTVKLVNDGLASYSKKVGDVFRVSAYVSIPESGYSPIAWSSSDKSVAEITAKGKVTCKKTGKTTLKAVSGGKSIRIALTVSERTAQDGMEISRGEWIHLLMQGLQKQVAAKENLAVHYFGDTEGTVYEAEIETAQMSGILPPADSEGFEDSEQDIPLFRPEETATREFAAYTAVKALGFQNDGTRLNSADASELRYPEEDNIAVRQKLLLLKANCFQPSAPFTYGDKDVLFDAVSLLNRYQNKNTAPAKTTQSVSYEKNVIQAPLKKTTGYTITKNGDGSYTVVLPATSAAKNIKKGRVFVLPANKNHPNGVALKAVSVKKQGANYKINGKVPEVQEVLSEVSFDGQLDVKPDQFIPAEGVSCVYNPSEGLSTGTIGGSMKVPGSWTFTLDNKKLSEKAAAKGTLTVTIPDVTCKLKTGKGFSIEELTLSTTQKVKFKGSIDYKFAETKYTMKGGSGHEYEFSRIELGRTPPLKLGTTGLSLEIVFFYTAGVNGSASFTYEIQATEGFQYANGNFRNLSGFEDSLDSFSLCGTAKAGLGASLVLDAFELIDLVGVDAQGGIQGKAEFTEHDMNGGVLLSEPLYCANGVINAYLSMELDPETAFGKLLSKKHHYTCSWDLITEKNSPLKLSIHLENGQKVEECTLGKGSISGSVQDADSHKALKKSRVLLYLNGDELKNVYTDEEGNYTLTALAPGDYTLKISATGYNTYENTVSVKKNEVTYAEASMMVDRKKTTEGTVYGNIVNALTGEKLDGVTYEVRKNWNNSLGAPLESGTADESYSLKLEAGNYTIHFTKADFIANNVNVTVVGDKSSEIPAYLSPENVKVGNDLRIVLTWGRSPADLDSHLLGTGSDGDDFHIYYRNETYTENGEKTANLDLDDTNGYGPETTTVYSINPNGSYSYYVHNYTDKGYSYSSSLSTSRAMVKVYTGNQIIAKYSVPTGKIGTLWHVFDYDPSAGVVTGVNEMTNLYSPSSLSRGYDRTLAQREEIWQDIQENPKEETRQKTDISETEPETAETEQRTDSELSELEEMLGVLPEEERTVLRTLAESRNWEDAEKAAAPFAELPEQSRKRMLELLRRLYEKKQVSFAAVTGLYAADASDRTEIVSIPVKSIRELDEKDLTVLPQLVQTEPETGSQMAELLFNARKLTGEQMERIKEGR